MESDDSSDWENIFSNRDSDEDSYYDDYDDDNRNFAMYDSDSSDELMGRYGWSRGCSSCGGDCWNSACETNDMETMRNFINTGFNINEKINYTTCLHQAINREHFEMVELLLDSGANLRCLDFQKYGPLHVAIQIKNRQTRWRMVQLLLKSGASVDDTNYSYEYLQYSTTCIHEAVKMNDFDLVLSLLSAGAELNCFSSHPSNLLKKVTPLQEAMISLKGRARYEMVKRLLAAGSDVKLCHDGHTTLHSAVSQKQCSWQLVKLLLDAGAELNVLNKLGYSPLALAAQSNHLSVVKNLIHNGVDVNISRSYLTSALALAISQGHKNIADVLLRNGADINAKHADGKSLLYNIVSRSSNITASLRLDLLRMALSHGAVMVSTEFGTYMPFKSVLQYGDIESMNLFIDNGLRLQECGIQFPLHEAIMNPNENILQYLLKSKLFDVDESNNKGLTALVLAANDRKTKHARLLIEWGADVSTPCTIIGLSMTSSHDKVPLLYAIITEQSELVSLLLAAGASIKLSSEDSSISQAVQTVAKTKTFVEYLVLFKSKGFKIDKLLKNFLKRNVSNISKSIYECKAELSLLKTVVFYDRITLYDLLVGKDITRYLSNMHAKTRFESLKLDELYPHYGMQIKEFYHLSLLKRELNNVALRGLRKIFGFRFCGDDIYLNITRQLSIRDLRNLSSV
ncbi:hypothetical protein QAD02_011150 [Eretmocerus hayati]|uniref:Uncharacterized protein n=1 Tax=Eretmocerus hayati TaxID=131215 RepID=A0ACC2NYM0_9HYME|nr:hypothetical protein QAD02_011150 [Eretmocerus hayati]